MNAAAVNREIRDLVRPVLQTHGFEAFTDRTAWRYWPGRIDIVNFQSFNDYLASSLGCTTFSFALNLSVYLADLPDGRQPIKVKNGRLRPEEFHGQLRLHPHRTIDQCELERRDIWFIDREGTYTSVAVRDARDVIVQTGLPWFEQWRTDSTVLTALESAEPVLRDGTELPGAADSPARHLVAGYVARRQGERASARRHLARALELFDAIDQKNAAMTLRKPLPIATPPRLRQDVMDLTP